MLAVNFPVVMKRSYQYIQQNKPALFDWLIFSISLSLGFIFPSLREFVISPAFSYWMLAAVLLYTTGAWLKHPPLYYRIIRSGKPRKAIPLLFILIAGHWLIFMTVVYFSETAVRKILHLPKITLENASNGWSVFITIIMASFITWLVFRNRKTIKEITHFSATNLFRRELVADIFL